MASESETRDGEKEKPRAGFWASTAAPYQPVHVVQIPGVIKWSDASKSHASLRPESGGPDIPIDASSLLPGGDPTPGDGARVVVHGLQSRHGSVQAVRILSLDGGSAAEPRRRNTLGSIVDVRGDYQLSPMYLDYSLLVPFVGSLSGMAIPHGNRLSIVGLSSLPPEAASSLDKPVEAGSSPNPDPVAPAQTSRNDEAQPDEIAAAVRDYAIQDCPVWETLTALYPGADLFAIESDPRSYEIQSDGSFDGRAEILLSVPRVLRSGKSFEASIAVPARVFGKATGKSPHIASFALAQ